MSRRPPPRMLPVPMAMASRRLGAPVAMTTKCHKSTAVPPKYDHTINLPKTAFPMRAGALTREHMLQERCMDRLYKWQRTENVGPAFEIHDGPPYANGSLHIGHALNKILKDIINRYKIMRGFKVRFVPGWDCHGLPIELKALGTADSAQSMPPTKIRSTARKFAEKTIEEQRKRFMRWGVLGEWDNAYLTMTPAYEAKQIEVFAKMYLDGHIYRAFKPVYWSPSSRTALAEAELDYMDNHKSKSVYAKFPIVTSTPQLSAALSKVGLNENVAFVIWTTTPWTLPANQAVAINSHLMYSVFAMEGHPGLFIAATDRLPHLEAVLKASTTTHIEVSGDILLNAECAHPTRDGVTSPVLNGSYVTTESGSGVVHTAPSHGMEDFITCVNAGIAVMEETVDENGVFTVHAGLEFEGKNVLGDGNTEAIRYIKDRGLLLTTHDYTHKYPYDWRTKQPIILRGTLQWFGRVGGDLRDIALKALDTVEMIPPTGRNRLSAMLCGRGDWCLSRQRAWGVPIPAFYDPNNDMSPVLDAKTTAHVCDLMRQHGSNCWFTMSTDELLPAEYRGKGLIKGVDTMDVWFDSGSSWASVLEPSGGVADIYLEGSDQHRGWFQSSLITSSAATGAAPFKTIITHGFTLDEDGKKMSKSLGNVIDPTIVVEGGKDQKKQPGGGADALRLWVASVDYRGDVSVGPNVLAQTLESLRRLRNATRFLLGNLNDFNANTHSVPFDDLLDIDKYTLHRLKRFGDQMTEAYDTYAFYRAYQWILTFVNAELSAFYFEVCKDRLYTEAADSHSRRCAQTTLFHICDVLIRSYAPFVPHLAEDAWLHNTCVDDALRERSVFATGWMKCGAEWSDDSVDARWNMAKEMRSAVNRLMEDMRDAREIRGPLDARVIVRLPNGIATQMAPILAGADPSALLNDLFLTSYTSVSVGDGEGEVASYRHKTALDYGDETVHIAVDAAQFAKCPRCWKRTASDEMTLCARCAAIVNEQPS